MNRKRLMEWGKTLLIILLAISAFNLSRMVGLLSFPAEKVQISTQNGSESPAVAPRAEQAASPLAIMITATENAHHGVKYSGESINEVRSWLSAGLGEALGSSGEPEEVSAQRWEKALHNEGVYFDYLYDQSVSALARWLGVEISSDLSLHTARRFCLSVEDESVSLYYIRALDGKAYRCETAMNGARLSERLSGYAPNGAMFAFEAGEEYENIDPYYCVMDSISEVSALSAENPLLSADSGSILVVFGMNPLVASHYVETDGTQVFVEGEQNLRISGDGRILYSILESDAETEFTAATSTVISKAYGYAMAMPGAESSSLQMSGISYDQDAEEYTVGFDYIIDGMVICFGGRACAMEFIIDASGVLQRADILCRNYVIQGKTLPMPEEQALAVIGSLGGGEPMLCYADKGENVEPQWVIKH